VLLVRPEVRRQHHFNSRCLLDLGPFLTKFRESHPSTPVTLFLRTDTLDVAAKKLGNVEIVHGDFEKNIKELEDLVSKHAVVINGATSRDVPVNEAVLRGIARRNQTGAKTILIHLSGAGNFVDGGRDGIYSEKAGIFDDTDPDQVRKINADMLPNGPSDEIIISAASKGEVNAYFICPTGIIGQSKNHFARQAGAAGAKYANTPGVWAGWMMDSVSELGFSPYVGQGSSVFWTVHVDDVVDLMLRVYDKAIEIGDSYQPEDVYSHWYLSGAEKLESKIIAKHFAELMVRLGKIPKSDVRLVAYEDAGIVGR
jgi:nucleoside-diphosphate-sugar epimerase